MLLGWTYKSSPPALVRGYIFAQGQIRAAKVVLPQLRRELGQDNRSLHGSVINTTWIPNPVEEGAG